MKYRFQELVGPLPSPWLSRHLCWAAKRLRRDHWIALRSHYGSELVVWRGLVVLNATRRFTGGFGSQIWGSTTVGTCAHMLIGRIVLAIVEVHWGLHVS